MRSSIGLTLVAFLSGSALASPPVVQHRKLANGLELLVVENHSLPLVTIEIAAKNGAMTEGPAYSGLSHLYEHMFFKANEVLRTQELYMSRVRQLGIEFNGTTAEERVNYFFTTTSDHLSDAMVFMRDALLTPAFDEAEFEREKVVVTGELDRKESSPLFHLAQAVDRRVWWRYPTRKNPIGDRKSILAATTAKMRTIQHRYYIPNNSALVVTGDVNADEIFSSADALYRDWKRGPDPFKRFPLVEHPPIPATQVVVVQEPVATIAGTFTWHGPSTVGRAAEYTYAADLLSGMVAGRSSRFQRDLVDSGACLSARLQWLTRMNTGPIALDFEADVAKVDDCVHAILIELPRLRQAEYFSKENMKTALHQFEVDAADARERPSSLAHELTSWWASASLDYYFNYLSRLALVSDVDIGRFLDKYLVDKPYVFGVMLPPAVVAKGLDQAHFESLIGVKPSPHVHARNGGAVRSALGNLAQHTQSPPDRQP